MLYRDNPNMVMAFIYEQYPNPSVMYSDIAGQKLHDMYQDHDEGFTAESYMKILVKHPVDACAIYVRHLINLLTPLYPEVYIKDFAPSRLPLFLANFGMWLLGILAFTQRIGTGNKIRIRQTLTSSNMTYCILPLVPCIAIIPGAPETRFFLPIYLLMYALLCFRTDYRALLYLFQKHVAFIIISGLSLLGFWAAVISSTLATTQLGVRFFL